MKSYASKSSAGRGIGYFSPTKAALRQFKNRRWKKPVDGHSDMEGNLPSPDGEGKTYFVPSVGPNAGKGKTIPIYRVNQGKMEPTSEIKAEIEHEPGIQKLLSATKLVHNIISKYSGDKKLAPYTSMQTWLGTVAPSKTYIRFSSIINKEMGGMSSPENAEILERCKAVEKKNNPDSKDPKIDERGTSAATLYQPSYEINKHGWINFDGRGKVSVRTCMAFEEARRDLPFQRPSGGYYPNLMLFDREDIMKKSIEEVSKDVFHEFYVHLSLPKKMQAAGESNPLDGDVHHDTKGILMDAYYDRKMKEYFE